MGRNIVDRQRRTDENHFYVKDSPDGWVFYEGRTDRFDAAYTDPVWQVKRIILIDYFEEICYANDGKYNCKWSERTSLFPNTPPIPSYPPPPSEVTQRGLSKAGKVTEIEINDTTWTALPGTPQEDRNAISIQNTDPLSSEIKINYADDIVGYKGVVIASGSERFYDITDGIQLYGKAKIGTFNVTVEEIS